MTKFSVGNQACGALIALLGTSLLSGCNTQGFWAEENRPTMNASLTSGSDDDHPDEDKGHKPPVKPDPRQRQEGPKDPKPYPHPSESPGPHESPDPDDAPGIAVNWIEYKSLPSADLKPLMTDVNELWSQCGIAFRIQNKKRIEARDLQLPDPISEFADLFSLRRKFSHDKNSLLVVATGEWDRRGGIGNSQANAWTAMPGDEAPGAVLDAVAARDSRLIAHELGHLMTLGHQSSGDYLMNPLVYADSNKLSSSECESARWAMDEIWNKAVRR